MSRKKNPTPSDHLPIRADESFPLRSLNSTKHGLNARSLILPHLGETVRAYKRHLASVIESLRPAQGLESDLVEQIAELLWRQRRVIRYRVQATIFDLGNIDRAALAAIDRGEPPIDPEKLKKLASLPDVRRLRKADKHEAHNLRSIRMLYRMLFEVQAGRKVKLSREQRTDQKGHIETIDRAVRHRLTDR
jgi:hypothetical protein